MTNKNQPVRDLQTMLRVIAEAEPGLPKLNPDGIFGQDTKKAVMIFQQTHSLLPDGVVNEATWNAVADTYAAEYYGLVGQPSLCPALSAQQEIRPEEENCHICLIQAILHTLAQRFENLPEVAMTGRYDSATQNAVRIFKEACGHQGCENGIDRCFLQELFCTYRCVSGDGRHE